MHTPPPSWLTQSDSGKRLLSQLKRAAKSPLAIYLHGETGVGKEILAQHIHFESAHHSGPLITLHCAALSPHLVESELFGHKKGAFTGAHEARQGALLAAHGGTLFLDEAGELPPETQVKLLRFLENGEVRPVGSDRVLYSHARVVAATHVDLEALVKKRLFREDLYFRIAAIRLEIPPLRERPEDIELQATAFSEALGIPIDPFVMAAFKRELWPGNSRELKRRIQEILYLATFPRIQNLGQMEPATMTWEDLQEVDQMTGRARLATANHIEPTVEASPYDWSKLQRDLILSALTAHRGNRDRAALSLGISRSTLYSRLKEMGLTRPPLRAFNLEPAWRNRPPKPGLVEAIRSAPF